MTDQSDHIALDELLKALGEIGNVKERAFQELKLFSRKLLGIVLLADDLGAAASLDDVRVRAREDGQTLQARHAALAATVTDLEKTESALRSRNSEAERGALEHAVPAISSSREFAAAGGLMS